MSYSDVKRPLVAMTACAICLVIASTSQAQHFDTLLTIDDVTGKVATGSVEFGVAIDTVEGVSVYEAELAVIQGSGSPGGTVGEPGFNAESSTTGFPVAPNLHLPGGADVSIDFKTFSIGGTSANLWYWDGTGAVSFSPVTDHTIEWQDGAESALLDGSNADVLDFDIGTTDPNGLLHNDMDAIEFAGPGSSEPTDYGIYLWSMQYEVDSGSSVFSDPVYWVGGTFVFDDQLNEIPGWGEDDVEFLIHEAEEWVEENLLASNAAIGAPEPSSALLVLLGVLGSAAFGGSRRRNRS